METDYIIKYISCKFEQVKLKQQGQNSTYSMLYFKKYALFQKIWFYEKAIIPCRIVPVIGNTDQSDHKDSHLS